MKHRADPHCHTTASDGMATPAALVDGAVSAGLDLIAVADHDTMAATRETVARGEEAGLAVIPGEEITCRWPALTHVVGLFLERPVRAGMTVLDTVKAIHDQGGLAVIPHPYQSIPFGSCQPGTLERLVESTIVDGIEVAFTGGLTASRRRDLEAFLARNPRRVRARLGASDSHFGQYDLARIVTLYPGGGAAGFMAAILNGQTVPQVVGDRPIPRSLVRRQRLKSMVELPLRRVTGRLR